MISHKANSVSNSDSLIGVTRKQYLGPVSDQSASKDKPVADDEQDLGDVYRDKYMTAVTFSLNLKNYEWFWSQNLYFQASYGDFY